MVALNKIDLPGAADNVKRVRDVLGSACMPVSARGEWWLYEQQRRGHLTYAEGGGSESVKLASNAPETVVEQWAKLRAKVFDSYGTTGVLDVISAAVIRRQPVFVCPVVDFSTMEGLPRAGGRSGVVLGSLLMLRPLSTVEEVFMALRHEEMLRGEFVRAEMLDDAASAP